MSNISAAEAQIASIRRRIDALQHQELELTLRMTQDYKAEYELEMDWHLSKNGDASLYYADFKGGSVVVRQMGWGSSQWEWKVISGSWSAPVRSSELPNYEGVFLHWADTARHFEGYLKTAVSQKG